MFAEKGCALIKEIHRNPGTLPPYNEESVHEIASEIKKLIEENLADANENENSLVSYIPTIRSRHAVVQRNTRCLLAYHYERLRRLRTMRWEFGSILPADIKANLSSSENTWFNKYSTMLAKFMRNVGDDGGVNLAMDLQPPKALYIEVKCLADYGKYELSDGSVLLLKKNSRHFLPRVECEELIRQGVCEHIVI